MCLVHPLILQMLAKSSAPLSFYSRLIDYVTFLLLFGSRFIGKIIFTWASYLLLPSSMPTSQFPSLIVPLLFFIALLCMTGALSRQQSLPWCLFLLKMIFYHEISFLLVRMNQMNESDKWVRQMSRTNESDKKVTQVSHTSESDHENTDLVSYILNLVNN